MTIHPLCATVAVLVSLLAAPALAQQSASDTGGPIATQAAVNTPPANPPPAQPVPTPVQPTNQGPATTSPTVPPAQSAAAAAALRAAVFSGSTPGASPSSAAAGPAAAATPQSAAMASAPSQPPAPASTAIATLGSASTAGAAASQTTELAPGLPVKDRMGVVIGQVTGIEDDRKYGQLVTVQMGEESFRLPNDRFGLWGGAATINLTQADIEAQLHRKR